MTRFPLNELLLYLLLNQANLARYTPGRNARISCTPLHIGDIVCLRCPHHQGFLHAEGFVDNLCGMLPEPRNVHQVRLLTYLLTCLLYLLTARSP